MRFRPVTWLLIGFVKAWRAVISPLYGDVCKFRPTCSEYGLQALQQHGALKGSWLTIRRIGRCHPWSVGGFDPVPGTPDALAHAGGVPSSTPAPAGTTPVDARGDA